MDMCLTQVHLSSLNYEYNSKGVKGVEHSSTSDRVLQLGLTVNTGLQPWVPFLVSLIATNLAHNIPACLPVIMRELSKVPLKY